MKASTATIKDKSWIIVLELAAPILLIGIWWATSEGSTSPYFPPLQAILTDFVDIWIFDGVSEYLLPTLTTFFVGYSIAIVLGITLGLLLAASDAVSDFFSPLLEFMRALPAIALVPAFITIFGLDDQMRISIVVFASLWPVLLNTVDGARGIDTVVRDTAFAFRINSIQRLLLVTIPGASPQIMAGVRVGMSLSLIAVIVTEMVTSAEGVGAFSRSAQMSFDLTGMWTAIILMGIVGYTLNLLFDQVEKRILRWHLHMQASAQ